MELSSDEQQMLTTIQRRAFDYFVHETNPEDGLISDKTAEHWPASIAAIGLVARFTALRLDGKHRYGFKATFNPTFPGDAPNGWVSPWHFGINEGPIVIMIENYLTRQVWQLTRQCEPLVRELRRAGFGGGWLDAAATDSRHGD